MSERSSGWMQSDQKGSIHSGGGETDSAALHPHLEVHTGEHTDTHSPISAQGAVWPIGSVQLLDVLAQVGSPLCVATPLPLRPLLPCGDPH